MNINIHVHLQQEEHRKLDRIIQQGETILAKVDELMAELEAANTTTNEIAADVQDLLNRLAEGGLTVAEADQVKAQIVALTDRLKGVAASHTPTTPPPA